MSFSSLPSSLIHLFHADKLNEKDLSKIRNLIQGFSHHLQYDNKYINQYDSNKVTSLVKDSIKSSNEITHTDSIALEKLPQEIQMTVKLIKNISSYLFDADDSFFSSIFSSINQLFENPLLFSQSSSNLGIYQMLRSFLIQIISNSSKYPISLSQDALVLLLRLSLGMTYLGDILECVEQLLRYPHLGPLKIEWWSSITFNKQKPNHNILSIWGQGDLNRLGLTLSSIAEPQNLPLPHRITSLSVFSAHVLAVTQHGQVIGWGSTSNGRLGLGDNIASCITPTVISLPQNLDCVTMVSVGLSHSLFLSSKGTVWSCGHGANGRLGTGQTTECKNITLIPNLDSIASICCGSTFSLAVSNDGQTFFWGRNNVGQSGTGLLNDIILPTHINLPPLKIGEKNLAAGWDHVLAVTSEFHIYSWGNGYQNNKPVLGHGTKEKCIIPTRISSLNNVDIIKVACGYDHSMCIDKDGQLYTWGNNISGQLGTNDKKERLLPTKVGGKLELPIIDMDGGMEHSLCVDNKGQVFSWGRGGTLGLGHFNSVNKPIHISLFPVSHVYCGEKFSIVLPRSILPDYPPFPSIHHNSPLISIGHSLLDYLSLTYSTLIQKPLIPWQSEVLLSQESIPLLVDLRIECFQNLFRLIFFFLQSPDQISQQTNYHFSINSISTFLSSLLSLLKINLYQVFYFFLYLLSFLLSISYKMVELLLPPHSICSTLFFLLSR